MLSVCKIHYSNGAGASGEAVKAVVEDLGIEQVDELMSEWISSLVSHLKLQRGITRNLIACLLCSLCAEASGDYQYGV